MTALLVFCFSVLCVRRFAVVFSVLCVVFSILCVRRFAVFVLFALLCFETGACIPAWPQTGSVAKDGGLELQLLMLLLPKCRDPQIAPRTQLMSL